MINNVTINFLSNTLKNKYGYIAMGNGNTSESMNDVALEDELVRQASVNTIITTNTLNDTSVFYSSFYTPSETTFREMGLFDSNISGDLFDRIVFTNAIVKGNSTINVRINVITKEI